MSPPKRPSERDGFAPIDAASVQYSLRLAKITERYLVAVGGAIAAAFLSLLVSITLIVVTVSTIHDLDTTKQQACNGIEDVVRETLIPLDPPPHATPEQLQSYASANRQKLARLHQLTVALARSSDCRISVDVSDTTSTTGP